MDDALEEDDATKVIQNAVESVSKNYMFQVATFHEAH
jgi:hypothetical protein